MSETAPRRRRRWPIVLLVVVVVLALLVAALAIVGESLARSYAEERAKEELASALGIADPDDVDVDLGSGSVLVQAAGGSLDEVTADTDALEVSGIRGSVHLVASGVPVRGGDPVDRVSARLTIPKSQAGRLAALVKGVSVDRVALGDGLVTASSSAKVLGIAVPLSIELRPSADAGNLVLTPTTLEAAGRRIDVADLRGSLLSGLVKQLPARVPICVNERLPKGLGLTGVSVTPSRIALTASGADVPLGGGGHGTCGS